MTGDSHDERSKENYYLYLTSDEDESVVRVEKLEEGIKDKISGQYQLKQAGCGIIAIFSNQSDFDKFLQFDFLNLFGVPIQIANLCNRDKQYRNFVTFRNVPWCISNKELAEALKFQGIQFGSVCRARNNVRVEVLNLCHSERLLKEGLNFYNVTSFPVVEEGVPNNDTKEITQCYKCQGFWHTANYCKHSCRCVRCGENHVVDNCPRPKNNPICCNCGGHHHAAYKLCPIKLRLANSVKVAFSLACKPKTPNYIG